MPQLAQHAGVGKKIYARFFRNNPDNGNREVWNPSASSTPPMNNGAWEAYAADAVADYASPATPEVDGSSIYIIDVNTEWIAPHGEVRWIEWYEQDEQEGSLPTNADKQINAYMFVYDEPLQCFLPPSQVVSYKVLPEDRQIPIKANLKLVNDDFIEDIYDLSAGPSTRVNDYDFSTNPPNGVSYDDEFKRWTFVAPISNASVLLDVRRLDLNRPFRVSLNASALIVDPIRWIGFFVEPTDVSNIDDVIIQPGDENAPAKSLMRAGIMGTEASGLYVISYDTAGEYGTRFVSVPAPMGGDWSFRWDMERLSMDFNGKQIAETWYTELPDFNDDSDIYFGMAVEAFDSFKVMLDVPKAPPVGRGYRGDNLL